MPRRPGGPEGLWAPGLLNSYLPLPEFRPLPAWPPSRSGLQLPAPGAFSPCESSELATATSDRVSSPLTSFQAKFPTLPHFLPHGPRPFLSLAWASQSPPPAPPGELPHPRPQLKGSWKESQPGCSLRLITAFPLHPSPPGDLPISQGPHPHPSHVRHTKRCHSARSICMLFNDL